MLFEYCVCLIDECAVQSTAKNGIAKASCLSWVCMSLMMFGVFFISCLRSPIGGREVRTNVADDDDDVGGEQAPEE